MALLPAYAVDGGRVPAAMARRAVYATSSGAAGVVAPDDFKVTALPTPGGAVQIARGSALCPSPSTGANQFETYVVAADSATNLAIAPTGSSARTDYVIARVLDWHFTGDPAPADPLNALYWEFATVSSLNGILTPYVLLATIKIPASTSAITAAMITDERKVAIPRRERSTSLRYMTAGTLDLTSSTFSTWPAGNELTVEVPSWAGSAIVRADVLDVLHAGGANVDGRFVLMLGNQPAYTAERRYDEVWVGGTVRNDYTVVAGFNVPASFRGTEQPLRIRSRRTAGTGYLRQDNNTQVVWDIEWLESAV